MSELTPLQRAFIALEETRGQLKAAQRAPREPIAVIGLGCRVPGDGDDPASFWRMLRDGVDATGPVPPDRWDVDATYHPDPEHVGTIAARRGGFLRRVDGFDPAFFGITRREAQGMDPQQRLFLEVCWEALEHAGQPPDRLDQSPTGVYVGVCGSDYAYLQLETHDRALLDAHFASGIGHSVASGRLSYLLGLHGPSLTLDTACSSSLVAIHLASQALRAGDCRMALAGGVNLILSADIYVALSHSRMLAPDGRCKTFDAAADGFARGEGCGVVVLKRLCDADADGDRVLAVIRGSAVNQDGASSGLTAPSGPAQEAVVREALSRSGIAPRLVSYIEAHGTGTQLGDPLELRALGAVFAGDRPDGRPLLVGSVKTNVGHLEAAAGVTGLIKVVLALQHRTLPAHLHCTVPTPHIAWDELRLDVPTSLRAWEPIEGRRIAGVSSFGFSGTNAHIVLEEAVTTGAVNGRPAPRRHLFVLSAYDEAALRASAARHAQALLDGLERDLADVCCTAAMARAHHACRATVLASSVAELCERLNALVRGEDVDGVRVSRATTRDPVRVAFLFTGQGAQYVGMGRQLFEDEPVFREAIERCATILDGALGRSLVELLYGEDEGSTRLDETQYTQPALFALEYALASLWRSWGVTPDVVIGHSVGEYVAACLAGVVPLDDALRLIAERGRLMQSLPSGGAMAAVFAPESDVAPLLVDHAATVSIAAVNGQRQTVISGAAAGVDAICEMLSARGVRCRRLTVSHAFHSPLVDPVLDAFERTAAGVRFGTPTMPLVSNVTGAIADARSVTRPAYWRDHIRAAVRFADGMRAVAARRPAVCVEIGPHPTLLPMAQDAFDETVPAMVPSLRKAAHDREQLDEALGALFLAGAPIDWRAVWCGSRTGRPSLVDLPAYPFQRERCWFTSRAAAVPRGRATGHPLLGVRLQTALRDIVQFEAQVHPEALPYLRDHRVQGRLILPAAAFVEMALSAGQRIFGAPQNIDDLLIGEPLVVGDDETRRVQTVVRISDGGPSSFEVLSAPMDGTDDVWRLHAKGSLSVREAVSRAGALDVPLEGATRVSAEAHQAGLADRGLTFGPSLQGVRQIEFQSGEARGAIALPAAALEEVDQYVLPPALLDACLQVLAAAIPTGAATGGAYLPLHIGSVRVYRTPGRAVTSRAVVALPEHLPASTLTGHVTIADTDGLVAELVDITMRVAADSLSTAESPRTDLYTVSWETAEDDAGWVPAVSDLAAQVGPELVALGRGQGFAEYHEGFVALEVLSTRWIVHALRELGWAPAVGESVRTDVLANQLCIVPRYHRLLGRLLAILEEEGILRRTADGFVVARIVDPDDPSTTAATMLPRYPSSRARIELARRCGDELAGILRGTVDPLQRLFPDGSTELASSLYRDTPEAVAYNQLIRSTVQALANRLPAGKRLRVLEVGGGTGGTTAWVAPALDPSRTSYLFTDLGPTMVRQARERFGSHAFMEFAPFDLEREAQPQIGKRQFDLILASNVVHATADLRRSVDALYALLAPGGTLLMLEVAGRERWIDITFGLTDGWWRFTDVGLRPDYPLLSRSEWTGLLGAAGFETAEIGDPHPQSREVLLAARKPAGVLPPAGRRWLILADTGGVGRALSERLDASGHSTVVLTRDATAAIGASAIDAIAAHAADAAGIVHLWSLDLAPLDDGDSRSLLASQEVSLGSLLATIQALGRLSFTGGLAARLWIGTRGAQAVDGTTAVALSQSPVWGLGRTIAREHPELQPTCVDLDPNATVGAQADALMAMLGRSAAEDQYAIREGVCLVPRLIPCVPAGTRAAESPRYIERLERASSGLLDDLVLVEGARTPPGRGQIALSVHAAGLNFRDVMNAMAMRDDPEPLGGECAGRVVAVGEGVEGFAPGDDVVAIAEGCFATYAVADAAHVAGLPPRTTFAQAATVPFAFMTARFALHECASLQSGETVLIHAAAGGVGLAAVQIAQALGATVIGTAGSEAKRAFLRQQGVPHVLDSRSLAFEGEVRRLTGGRGVDVVLNSLAGNAITASVGCLADAGRFLEIGKRDIWTPDRFAGVRPHGRYLAIDLAVLRQREPSRSAALFAEVIGDLATGRLHPLPLRAFPLQAAAAAFRFMAQARHIGKIVLVPVEADQVAFDDLSPQATYLVTGGLTGIGLLSAEHLVDRGARHLMLVGRRAPDQTAQQAMDRLRVRGAVVRTMSADVGTAEGVSRVIDEIDATMPALRGILHSAGALDDGALVQQSWPRFVVPLRTKVDGAWALHVRSASRRLDFFVLYSSVASVLGSSGQGNHAAANAFLDALAGHRRALGLPAVSISWGAWSGVGAAADRGVDQRIGALGLEAIAPARGLELLDAATRCAAAHVTAMPVDWSVFLEHRPLVNGRLFFDRVVPHERVAAPAVATRPATAGGVLDLDGLRDASSAQQHARLLAFVGDHVARVIGAAPGRPIAVDQPLNELGLDSLMAVELRNRLGRGLQLPRSLPATLVFDHPTLEALTKYLVTLISPAPPHDADVEHAPAVHSDTVGAIDELTDEQIDALFAKRIGTQ